PLDGDVGTLSAHAVASGRLKLDPALDARVSLVATNELAKISPSYAADLEATTHFMQTLERATKGITDQLVMPDDLAALDPRGETVAGKSGAKHIAELVMHERGVNASENVDPELVYEMLQRAVHLARE